MVLAMSAIIKGGNGGREHQIFYLLGPGTGMKAKQRKESKQDGGDVKHFRKHF